MGPITGNGGCGCGASGVPGRRWIVGFLAPIVHGYFFGNILTGARDTAHARGGRVIAIQTFDPGRQWDSKDKHRVFTSQVAWDHLDAIIVTQDSVPDSYLNEYARTGRPVVAAFRESESFRCPIVIPDNRGGITMAVDHLIGHGHRSIAFIGREPPDADDHVRYGAYRDVMLRRGLKPRQPIMIDLTPARLSDATRAVRQLLELDEPPTAAVACTDLTACALVNSLTAAGISVPHDFAVIGFDDVSDAATLQPPLSTIAQSFVRAGNHACGLAIDALEGRPAEPGHHCTPVTFVRRQSCGCPPPVADGTPALLAGAGTLHDRVAAALTDLGPHRRELSDAQWQRLRDLARRVVELFASADPDPTTDAPDDSTGAPDGFNGAPDGFTYAPDGFTDVVEAVAATLREITDEEPDFVRVAGDLRQLARVVATRHGAADPGSLARLDRLASDVALALLGGQVRHLLGRQIDYRDLEHQWRYYIVSTDLIRRARPGGSLTWLAGTEVEAGCFGMWGDRRERHGDNEHLLIAGTYLRSAGGAPGGRDDAADDPGTAAGPQPPAEVCAVPSFPPAAFVDLVGRHADELLYLLPVCFGGHDWGYLAFIGQFDCRQDFAFERYNHWAALMTVALDQEQAMHAQQALLAEIRTSEERYALAAEAANDGLWDWDLACGTVYYSSRWKTLLGYGEAEIGQAPDEWLDRIHPDDRAAVDRALRRHVDDRTKTMELEYRLRAADGSYRWMLTHGRSMRDGCGRVTRLIGSMTDVTERRQLEDRLRQEAHYDSLTGLPNRALFLDRLDRAIARVGRRPDYAFAVVFFDLNGFKVINDSLGHQVGDEVLVQVAERLATGIRTNDTVSRFGGDEFVVLLDDVHDVAALMATVERMQSELVEPLTVGERTLVVSAAAGIALSTTGHRTADEFVRDADNAMYRAKAARDGVCVLFDDSMHAHAMARLQLESDLRQAVAGDQFELLYQPIIRLDGRRMVGAEALIRWHHPDRGLVSPTEFLPVAEAAGLAREIGRWTIRSACRQLRTWLDAGLALDVFTVSVNLSNRQFWDPELRPALLRTLAEYRLPPSALVVEVTEGVIMHNEEAASTLMRRLHDDGIRLHLDDFGTGYSSLAMLHQFPIDALKIDRSFVSRMGADPRSRELVRTMITMGINLGVEVIAEGIETEEEAAMLTAMGCPRVQGYLFSRPVPASKILSGYPAVRLGSTRPALPEAA